MDESRKKCTIRLALESYTLEIGTGRNGNHFTLKRWSSLQERRSWCRKRTNSITINNLNDVAVKGELNFQHRSRSWRTFQEREMKLRRFSISIAHFYYRKELLLNIWSQQMDREKWGNLLYNVRFYLVILVCSVNRNKQICDKVCW